MFSSRLLISVDISISCQDIGKEMLSKDGLLSLKTVSEQSTISGRVNWKYFGVLRRLSLSQFSEKMQKLKVIFGVSSQCSDGAFLLASDCVNY